MSNVQKLIKRNAYAFGASIFLLAATIPSIVIPESVAAAQLQERSVAMSSSTGGASNQSYKISFEAATTNTVEGVVVDFCSDSPIVGTACAFPVGMTVGSTLDDQSGLTGSGTWTASLINSNHSLLISNPTGGSVSSGATITVDVSGFTNPTGENKFYARILTYADSSVAGSYTSAAPGTHIDDGGVALMTAKAIGVTATVQESLTFCVSKSTPGAGCSGTNDPQIVLGTGTPIILDTQNVYEGDVAFQLSTNAVGNTFIRMKGSTLTSGSNTIPAIGGSAAQTITAGTARFGMRSTTGAGVVGNTEGSVSAVAPYDGGVGGTQYGLDTSTPDDNITSTYGDVIASATGGVLNYNRTLTFGATAGATTPAGVYTAAFSLIASSSY